MPVSLYISVHAFPVVSRQLVELSCHNAVVLPFAIQIVAAMLSHTFASALYQLYSPLNTHPGAGGICVANVKY